MPDSNINFDSSEFLTNDFISQRRGRYHETTETTQRIIDLNRLNRYLIDLSHTTGLNINQNQNYDNSNYSPYVPNQPPLVRGGGAKTATIAPTAASIDSDGAGAESGLDVYTSQYLFFTFLLNIFFNSRLGLIKFNQE